jgi:hypothetical protein
MDELTRRLRELMKPIANGPLLEVEGLPVPEGEKKAWGNALRCAQVFASAVSERDGEVNPQPAKGTREP